MTLKKPKIIIHPIAKEIMNSKNNLLLSNMEDFVIGASSRVSTSSLWHAIPYKGDSFSGVMLQAAPNEKVAPIRIPLECRGPYCIYVGLYHSNLGVSGRIRIRIEGDESRIRISPRAEVLEVHAITEICWTTRNIIPGSVLILEKDSDQLAAIAYVRLEPVSEKADSSNLILHAFDDGYPENWGTPVDDSDAIWMVDGVKQIGFDWISRGIDLSGMANYASPQKELRFDCKKALSEHSLSRHRHGLELMLDWQERNIVVPEAYFRHGNELGMETFGYGRMALIQGTAPHNTFRCALLADHPEWFCCDRDGSRINRASFAIPEVRRHYLRLITESVILGATGVNNVFVRGVPLTCYEKPVAEYAKLTYGIDIASLSESDPVFQQVRSDFLRQYLQEQRVILNSLQKKHSPKVIVTVPATEKVCRFFGLDVASWIKEGLVDVVCPYPWGFNAVEEPVDIAHFARLKALRPVQILPVLNSWRKADPKVLIERAADWLKYDIDGFSIWDALTKPAEIRHIMPVLKSRSMIERCSKDGPPRCRNISIHTLDGIRIDKYPYGWNL